MTASKLPAHPALLNHTASGIGLVSGQLFPNGEYWIALRSQIWHEQGNCLDDGIIRALSFSHRDC